MKLQIAFIKLKVKWIKQLKRSSFEQNGRFVLLPPHEDEHQLPHLPYLPLHEDEHQLPHLPYLPLHEDEDQLPHLPTLHVMKIYKEKDEPHTSGDVALQHDHREQQASEHGAYTGCAQDPEAT